MAIVTPTIGTVATCYGGWKGGQEMSKSNGPCRVLIIASKQGQQVKRRINGTGYGADRHAARWIARGFDAVSVWVDSVSTGKQVEYLRVTV